MAKGSGGAGRGAGRAPTAGEWARGVRGRTMSKTTDDYAPCVRIDANGNVRRGNVKAALLLTPDAARAAPVERGVVYVRREDAEAVRNGNQGN